MKFRSYIVCILLMAISLCVFIRIQDIFIPKFYDDAWKTTSTYENFYQEEPDSIQVLFLGSSSCVTAFMPQYLYDNYGYTSYNLGCQQQSIVISYYWLAEALKYQRPNVVFLEAGQMYGGGERNSLNSDEAMVRSALDPMRFSSNKLNAVRDVCQLDNKHKLIGYLFPMYRYHDRWSSLKKKDFKKNSGLDLKDLKGYIPLFEELGESNYKPFKETNRVIYELDPVTEEYFRRIKELCRENNINLVLTKTPTAAYFKEFYNAMNIESKREGFLYVDFNEERFYYTAGYDYIHDNQDDSHSNIYGAKKITDFCARLLDEVYFLKRIDSPSFEKTKSLWEGRLSDKDIVLR